MNLAELARRLQPYLYPPGSGGGGGGVAPINASYVVMAANAILTNERIVTQGNGMALTDGGAGGALVIALATPGTLTVATTNAAVVGSHTHAITSSSNPGAAAAILASTSAGLLQLQGLSLRAAPSLGAALYVPWVTGDALPTAYFGASGTSNNQIAVWGETYSGTAGVYGSAVGAGDGVHGVGGSGSGVSGASGAGSGILGSSGTGRAGYFTRNNSGSALAVVEVAQQHASDANTVLLVSSAGTGSLIVAGGFSVLNDGFTTEPGRKRVSTQFNATTTTLANVTGLSVTLRAGRTYTFRAAVFIDSDPTGGFKIGMAGTATATAIIYQTIIIANGASGPSGVTRLTALGGSSLAVINGGAFATIDGTITVANAGSLTIQFAQNSASGTSSVLVGSFMIVEDMG